MRNFILILCTCSFLASKGSLLGQKPALTLVSKDEQGGWTVQLRLEEEQTYQPANFQVFTASEWTERHEDGQAIAGKKEQMGEQRWAFSPYFPFTEGMEYVAFYPGVSLLKFQIPKTAHPVTKLVAIYPKQDTVPENLLKMYIHFSAPMSVGNSYRHLQWRSAEGDTLVLPFLELEPELWNEDRTRLTLWLDPGRVKRDLVPNQLLGAPLVAGKDYRLVVDKNWKDIHGNPLKGDFQIYIRVGEADRERPKPDAWNLIQPEAGSRQALVLNFGEVLDFALMQKTISVWNQQDQQIIGQIQIGPKQDNWQFYPETPWQSGTYKILIDSKLEDLAGNNLNRNFDVDLQSQAQQNTAKSYHTLFLSIR